MKINRLNAMVLQYEPRLTHSIWVDLMHRARTESGLIRLLRKGVKTGQWIGWRLVTIHTEELGSP